MMWPWFGWGFGGFSWVMPIITIVVWGLIIWAVVAIVRGANSHSRRGPENVESPIDILKRRYASGEITREEYEEKKRSLN